MKTFYKYILLFVTFFYCYSCSNNNKEAGNIIKEWMGKVIIFPDIKPYTTHLNLKDSLKYVVPRDKTHKILLYVDSTGCTSCKIKSYIWKTYIEKIYSQVDFLFYIKPKIKEEILSLLEHDRFNYPIFIDDKDELNKLNRFPNNSMFQCFLLDKDNKVLAIGNPVHNNKIWELYKQIITGEISDKPPVTTVEPESTEIELNDLQIGKTSETVFSLKNTGKEPLIIQTVNASCGCTVPEWDKQPVTAGKSAKIKVQITPEEKGYFNKTVTVHCNTEEGQILLKVNGTVE
ncbi:MAG: DUF1573 domain-containing protein [Bacteroidales bacterium]|nr:DUF1573 domain-containing protein [Bacteroidales bacterium]